MGRFSKLRLTPVRKLPCDLMGILWSVFVAQVSDRLSILFLITRLPCLGNLPEILTLFMRFSKVKESSYASYALGMIKKENRRGHSSLFVFCAFLIYPLYWTLFHL